MAFKFAARPDATTSQSTCPITLDEFAELEEVVTIELVTRKGARVQIPVEPQEFKPATVEEGGKVVWTAPHGSFGWNLQRTTVNMKLSNGVTVPVTWSGFGIIDGSKPAVPVQYRKRR